MPRNSVPQAAISDATFATVEHLTPTLDRDRVDRDLAEFFEATRRDHASNPHSAPLYGQAADFVLRGGKRLRPRLCLAGYRILAGRFDQPPPRPVALAAASLEIFHAFMLAHDDLIDGSVVRRGRPTLHESIRLESPCPDARGGRKRSRDLALIAGDLLFALGMKLLGGSGLDDAALGRASRLVADMLFETGLGEALDVLYDGCPLGHLGEDQIVESYVRKTARYSVSGPLVLAATIAGAPDATIRALDRFGDRLGFGFQVQNDLDALEQDPESGDHPDLDAGKRTFVLWSAYHRLDDRGRRALDEALTLPAGVDRRRRLLALIAASGAVDACRARLESGRREAIAALRDSPLDAARRRQFVALAGLFRPSPSPAGFLGPLPDGLPIPENEMVDA